MYTPKDIVSIKEEIEEYKKILRYLHLSGSIELRLRAIDDDVCSSEYISFYMKDNFSENTKKYLETQIYKLEKTLDDIEIIGFDDYEFIRVGKK